MTDTYYHVDHPNAQRFDRVEARVVERWKESELSGDEWRFSFVVDLYSHGVLVESIWASSIQSALIQAAVRFDHFGPGEAAEKLRQARILSTTVGRGGVSGRSCPRRSPPR